MGVGSGGQGGHALPWIFIHGTNIVNKGLKVLFSAFFAIFRYFLLIFSLFPLAPSPLGKFSADALGYLYLP